MDDVGRFTFAAVPESLSAARSCVRGVLQSMGKADRELDINIAVGEVLQNVIRYGFSGGNAEGQFTIIFCLEGERLIIEVTDTAPPSDPQSWNNEHRKPEEGGHGLALVHAIVDEISFSMLEDGNKAVMAFAL